MRGEQRQIERKLQTKHLQSRDTVIVVPAIHPDNAKPMVRNVQKPVKWNSPQEPDQCQEEEDHIDTVNINSINFNSSNSVITANIKIVSNEVRIIVQYQVDTASDGNMLSHMYKKLFPRATKEQLVVTRNMDIQLKTYNRMTITQLGICKVKTITQKQNM